MKRLLLVLALAACDSPTAPLSAPGLWELSTVNDEALPFELIPATNSTPAFSVTGGEYNLDEDGTYTHSVQFGPTASFGEFGTYTFADGWIVFTAHPNRRYSIPLKNEGLMATVEGRQYRYVR